VTRTWGAAARALAHALLAIAWLPVGAGANPAGAAPARDSTRAADTSAAAVTAVAREGADASALYNAGTIALERGEIGPAVALLTAAKRLEPRASDIRANLAQAEAASLRARGGDAAASTFDLPAFVSAREAWWLAAVFLASGALLSLAGAFRPLPRRLRAAAPACLALGLLISGYLHIQAWEEKSHPEAVVVVPALSVERGPGEPSRAAVLLGAGERVRLGAVRGRQTEIRIGGNPIGWADREGLWKVVETPRYTAQYAKP
jgi:hypothetical protein